MNSPCLAFAEYVDSDHPDVVARSEALCADAADERAAARAIFVFVRDHPYAGAPRSRPAPRQAPSRPGGPTVGEEFRGL